MEFFCFHRDRPGSTPRRTQLVERHWSCMDGFAAAMIARGPTYAGDGTLSGSVHVLDLPDPAAARAFEEPGYQAGAYRDVLMRRWHNTLGTTMWDFRGSLLLGTAVLPEAPSSTQSGTPGSRCTTGSSAGDRVEPRR